MVVDIGAARAQLERQLELPLGTGPVEVMGELEQGQHRVRFAELLSSASALVTASLASLVCHVGPQCAAALAGRELGVRQGHTDVGQGIARVDRDRLPKVLDALLDALLGVSAVAVPPLEIELIGLDVVGRLPAYPRSLLGRELRLSAAAIWRATSVWIAKMSVSWRS